MPRAMHAKEILETDEVLGPRLKAALATDLWSRLPEALDRDSRHWRLDVLKFRPRRRLSLRLDMPCRNGTSAKDEVHYIMKIWYNRRGERIASRLTELNTRLLAAGEDRLRLPKPLFYDSRSHAMVYRQTDGRPITGDLRRGLSRHWIGRLAEVFAVFHRLLLEDLPTRTAEDELTCVRELLARQPVPDSLRHSLLSTLSVLENGKPAPSDRALVHRDLYDQQILLTDDGRIGLIDLDDIALGDPMLDLGNFLAHVHLMTHWHRRPEKLARVRRRLVGAYANGAGEDGESLAVSELWYEAVALARLSVFRARAGRTDSGLHMLRAACELVEGTSTRMP